MAFILMRVSHLFIFPFHEKKKQLMKKGRKASIKSIWLRSLSIVQI